MQRLKQLGVAGLVAVAALLVTAGPAMASGGNAAPSIRSRTALPGTRSRSSTARRTAR